MPIAPVSIAELVSLTEKMMRPGLGRRSGGVEYLWDAKADIKGESLNITPPLSIDSNLLLHLDCSGFVRYSAYKCSDGKCILPDGSYVQHQACAFAMLRPVRYSETANDTERLFLAFIAPTSEHAGHVWWIHGGRTMECHGGRGVDRRPWDTPVLLKDVCACYVFPAS